MKQSCNGSMSEICESRLKPCPGEREPVLRKLYIDLCNLIVESRIPGINDRGYGEGIHCPPLMGPSSHCCDLSIPECQKHQKLIHRLLRSMKRNIFEVEVFMLSDCCRETKLAEKIPKKEYVLLEQWSFNCFHGSKLQSSIDVPQLLRAVRSFLYFSQISAWLSANEGKSPSNIYYWVRPSSEVSTAKFENEPELHRFPLCKIYEGLYGAIEVRYRTRTQYVPIIPCSKHPPQENPVISVIDNSDVRQTLCLGTHIVKQLHKTCDTIHENPISDKTITEPLSNVLMSSNIPPSPVKSICGDVSENISKAKGILKHSNCQTYSENVFGLIPKLSLNEDPDQSVRMNINSVNSIRDVLTRHPGPKNLLLQRQNLTLPLKCEIRQRKLSRELLDSPNTDTDFTSPCSVPSSATKSKRKRHSSKALTINSKLPRMSSSNVSQPSSLILPEDLKDSFDGLSVANATSSDAINIHHSSKMKSCHFSELNTLPNKASLALDLTKKGANFSPCTKNSLNLSQHSLKLCIENNWNEETFSPISSKIIVSKCEPLLPQESSVPKRTKRFCQRMKRKALKCVHNCKSSCSYKNPSSKVYEKVTFERDILNPPGSEKNILHNFMKQNDAEKVLFSKSEPHSEFRRTNFKHKRMKNDAKTLSPATTSVEPLINSSHTKNKFETILDSSVSNNVQNNELLKLNTVSNLNTEKNHSVCNQNYLCSEEVQSNCCLNSFPGGTVSSFEPRVFRKRKLNDAKDCYDKADGKGSNKKPLFTDDMPQLLSCPSLISNASFDLKIQRRSTHKRKELLKSFTRAKTNLKTACTCSETNSNTTLEQNLGCYSNKMSTGSIESQEAELTDNYIRNASQKSKFEVNTSCLSTPNIAVSVNRVPGKSFKTNTHFQEKGDFSFDTSKPKLQLSPESEPKMEKTTYPSVSNELICDHVAKEDKIMKSNRTKNLLSGKKVFSSAAQVNKSEVLSTKLKKGRLLLNFEESILAGCLEPVKRVIGYKVEIGASGNFCPDHLTLPADVSFHDLKSSQQHTVPYMAHVTFESIEYFLPKKGSMQVTLFNPSETVVKMFVLSYDLSSMPPLHHTFIRQKTYYMPISATEKDPKWLRYIIHLRFASSKTGRIFLHKDLKIVVLNRSNDDAACDHIQEPCELRSFLSVPKNPAFSNLKYSFI